MSDEAEVSRGQGLLGAVGRGIKRFFKRFGKELASLVLILVFLLSLGLIALDTGPGHRFIADRIAALENADCSQYRIGRIEGSIYDEMVLRNVEVRDPNGAFVTISRAEVDWAPLAWLYNDLHIDRLAIDQLTVERLPELCEVESDPDKPILPGFDIIVNELTVDRLVVGEVIGGERRVGSVDGRVRIQGGTAMVDLNASVEGGDRLLLDLDVAPDDDRFDVAVDFSAPADGLVPALTGLGVAMELDVDGEGSWTSWEGTATGSIGEEGSLDLAMTAQEGLFTLDGEVDPAPLVGGTLRNLLAGGLTVDGEARLADRVLTGDVILSGRAGRAVASGAVDLGRNRFDGVDLGVDLDRPSLLLGNLGGTGMRLVATLDGDFDSFAYNYRLTSQRLQVDTLTLGNFRADGAGRWSRPPLMVPLTARAATVDGLGVEFADILRNVELRANLRVGRGSLVSEGLTFRSDMARGNGLVRVDFGDGEIVAELNAALPGYEIPGLGAVDVVTDVTLRPGAGGLRIDGDLRAQVTRLDNSFFAGLTGGLPVVEGNIRRGTDGIIRFENMTLQSPLLALAGDGYRRTDGTFMFDLTGNHETYGAVDVSVDGAITRPNVDLVLASPNAALGLSDVALDLDPVEEGFAYSANGGSRFGPFTSRGTILLPPEGQSAIQVDELNVAGSTGEGRLLIVPGGFEGQLDLTGGELAGTVTFDVPDGLPEGVSEQVIGLDLTVSNGDFPGPPAFTVRSGTLDGTIRLTETGLGADVDFSLNRVESAGIPLASVDGSVQLTDGIGTLDAQLVGAGDSEFSFDLDAAFDIDSLNGPNTITLSGTGTFDRRPIRLAQPATLTETEAGWIISDVDVLYGGGRLVIGGLNDGSGELVARMSRFPLALLDIRYPVLNLSGTASGTARYNPEARTGSAEIQLKNLSRAGLLFASRPIDMAVNARLNGNVAGARFVMEEGGEQVGRGQIGWSQIGAGDLIPALQAAPMSGGFRFDGQAETLWRLSNVELFDLTGPLDISIDIGGRLLAPRLSGSLTMDGGAMQSPVTGTQVDDLDIRGEFSGATLRLRSLSGTAENGGRVTGSGRLTILPLEAIFAIARNALNPEAAEPAGLIGLEMQFNAEAAQLINRDDLKATVTGRIDIESDGLGGTISSPGLTLVEGRYALGRAATATAVPVISVRERGVPRDFDIEQQQLATWNLNIDVEGAPLFVEGLGLESRWYADVDLRGTVTNPRIFGDVTLQRGEYSFAGRRFRVERGEVDFNGSSPINPSLDILAIAEGGGIDAEVTVTGNALTPQIRFTSSTISDQDEILSRLLFGTSVANLSGAELLQLGAAVASLQGGGGGGGLDPINEVRSALGLDRLRIVPADITVDRQTAIGAGKYITRRLYVEVITDGRGYTATQGEFQVTRWLAILATLDSFGRSRANVRVSKDY
ncbi:translocation/assembly module TamB domain-containing protein [Sphingomicrobium sediminis]|uniref:Translocation/assembly module TamB domain-containing protein n=1 Tax=Sphingomicrobium sediminis TaxID=2950949 RepID=A0A9X2J2N6_9SPHN|nr:translocation/assembly module TamB domain-containing protein [Sphingomicrobium sediminis]MCM8556481.1 translocation/assembly module TamB domain-containing protein [Sphingomicrobium sediminis]